MYELYQLWIEFRDKPLQWTSILAVLLYLFDRFARKFVTHHVKRLFHMQKDVDFYTYNERQKRIEHKIDMLLQKEGIVWNDGQLPNTKPTAPNYSRLSRLLRGAIRRGSQLRRKLPMNKNVNYVTMVIALLGAVKMILDNFGIHIITNEMIDPSSTLVSAIVTLLNIIAAVVTLVGIVMSHRKKGGDAVDTAISNTIQRTE